MTNRTAEAIGTMSVLSASGGDPRSTHLHAVQAGQLSKHLVITDQCALQTKAELSGHDRRNTAAILGKPLVELGRTTLQRHPHGIGVEHEALLHGQPLC